MIETEKQEVMVILTISLNRLPGGVTSCATGVQSDGALTGRSSARGHMCSHPSDPTRSDSASTRSTRAGFLTESHFPQPTNAPGYPDVFMEIAPYD